MKRLTFLLLACLFMFVSGQQVFASSAHQNDAAPTIQQKKSDKAQRIAQRLGKISQKFAKRTKGKYRSNGGIFLPTVIVVLLIAILLILLGFDLLMLLIFALVLLLVVYLIDQNS